ncbi:FtsX-like permease family protein [Thomasclavelia sp.]|uniref:FtsX-like permease family protein n=1 Tax=Thomasclavelia sp. TaxID=3025757 RepID=UPI0025D31E66|nr:FtsX-like permease family protein [Thomasclavelia sp.]
MITYIKKIVAGSKKFYLEILVILSFLASFEFISVIIYSGGEGLNNFIERLLLQIISGIVIIVSFILILFVNNYLIGHKTDEFSMILLCGKSTKEIVGYILMQFGVLFLLSYLIGAALGYLWFLIYQQIFLDTLTIYPNTIINVYIALFITKMIYVLMIDLGKFLRIKLDIASYMNHVPSSSKSTTFAIFSSGSTTVKMKKSQILGANIGNIITVILGILFLYIGLSETLSSSANNNLPIYFAFSLCGELMIINTLLTMVYDLLHNKFLLKSKNGIMILSNLKDSSKVMSVLINLSSSIVPIIIIFLYLQGMSPVIQNGLITTFIALMAGMFLCFIIRFILYIPSRANVIAMMKALGYSRSNIYWIHFAEIIIFALLYVLFPIVVYGLVLYQSYLNQMIVYHTFVVMISTYVGLYALMLIYMVVRYCKLIKEVYSDVKYLNRGE